MILIKPIICLVLCSLCYLSTDAQTAKLYPSTLKITKGKSNTATAVYKDANGQHVNVPFVFTSGNTNVVTASNDILEGGSSGNLASLKAVNSGTTTITATYNNLTTNPITVVVDDPAATPVAEIHGDNDASSGITITTKIGEPIEVNGDSSQGVASIEWNWGDGDKVSDVISSTHSYLQAGTYTLTLTIKNSLGAVATDTVTVNVSDFSAPTNTYTVTTAQQLLDAYNQCTGGEHIVIPAGTTILGHIELPSKNFSDYVTIRSSGTMPGVRDRITPNSSQIATLKGVSYNIPTLKIKNGASKLRFIGLKFEPLEQNNYDQFSIIEVGEYYQTNYSTNPQKIIFQHSIINPPDTTQVRHGMMNDGYKVAVISSWFGNIFTRCFPTSGCVTDSNAAYSLNGKGAHVYNNSYIEASSENILYGGDTVTVDGGVPTNIEVRRCYFYKRPAWKPNPDPLYNIKNLIEFKTGRRVYLAGNVFENHWIGADAGQPNAININTIAEFGSPWSVNEDIVFENNKVFEIPSGVLVSSANGTGVTDYTARKSQNIRFKNMLFDKFQPNAARRLFIANGVEEAIFDRVTQIDTNLTTSRLMEFASPNNYGLQITNSIVGMGTDYQIFSSYGLGRCALNWGTGGSATSPCTPNGQWNVGNNIFVRYNNDPLINPPANNCDSAVGYNAVGFVNLANGDYRLSGSGACYQGQTNIGADIPVLDQSTACTVSGIGTNCGGSSSSQTPYPGPNAPNAPTTVEVENFDKGGQGVAYNENNGNTGSSVYRSNPVEAVDIQSRSTASNGYAVFEASAGEWLEYTVNFPTSGIYDLGVTYASEFNNGKFHVEIDGSDVTGQLTANSTGNWGTFQTLTKTGVNVSAGTHVVRLSLDVNSPDSCGCVVANFDKLSFTAAASAGQGIVFNGSQYGQVTLPNTADFNNLNGFQMVWRVREAAHPTPTGLPGFIFSLPDIGILANNSDQYTAAFDSIFPVRSGDTHDGGVRITPATFTDSVCKLQFDPANSRWTLETWNADGTGYVSQTMTIQNTTSFDLRNQTLGIAASYYQNRPFKGKLDYWRWIKRVEPLGVFPTQSAPTGVNYLLDYEFEGNANDSSGKNAHLTLSGSPTYTTTP